MEELEPYIIDRRRYYHANPEPSGEEKNTRMAIEKDLLSMGITDIIEMKQCYGAVATIHGRKFGETVGLRTDIDALKITEQTGLPFASKNGYMHACGHDCHIAMLLGAARFLQENRDCFEGDIRLLIEPEEETDGGAKAMVREGAVEGLSALYGAHIWGDFDAPGIDITEGNRMAGNNVFTINVNGIAAHGSAPHLGIDAITTAAAIINNLQQAVTRMNDPVNPMVLTVGTIHGGTRFNVIPNHVTMECSLRTFSPGGKEEKMIRQIVNSTAAAFGATAEIDYQPWAQPLINKDKHLVQLAQNAVRSLYGEAGLQKLPTMMSSEDFSHFDMVPYVFGYIGSRNKEKGIIYTNHHEKFTVDESVLKRGSAVMAKFALDFLSGRRMTENYS